MIEPETIGMESISLADEVPVTVPTEPVILVATSVPVTRRYEEEDGQQQADLIRWVSFGYFMQGVNFLMCHRPQGAESLPQAVGRKRLSVHDGESAGLLNPYHADIEHPKCNKIR